MSKPESNQSKAKSVVEVEMEESRLLMVRRVKQMSVEERVKLFERLSRDAAWARSSKRVR